MVQLNYIQSNFLEAGGLNFPEISLFVGKLSSVHCTVVKNDSLMSTPDTKWTNLENTFILFFSENN